ncbi:N-acetylmuramoyl-L-alanine amidase family protein [Rossellomorea sp. BNER]|uniref:N-acetylmuramoyl-L-alanine amidase family protein n=1 Tax=Rossellomorea sp. BNER TaxID=2962031 RepID=UPI003AF1EA93|nr:N-acetylmuramoyl-L-alanine amidase [Rossellomorea sp. BNER]
MTKDIGNDFGHAGDTWERTGGKGVVVNGKVYEEHSFNVRVGLALSKHLKRCGIGEKRIQEPFKKEVSLRDRTNFYNHENVDVVLSNHANWNRNKNVKGICVFAWHNHEDSQRLQKLLVEEYEKLGFETHGVGEHESEIGSWTDLHIVRETKMTACLIENGFMSNPDDFKNIFLNPEYAEKCAEAQARALCRFFGIPFKGVENVAQKSVQIQTGGLSPEMVAEIGRYFDNKQWWAQIQYTSDGENPTALTGGLSPENRKEFEGWLKHRDWWYKIV